MQKIILVVFISVLGILNLTSCYAARVDGPYKGKVIDTNTGQPIEGVVVLGTWSREHISPGGATHTFYDAQETVTDKNGEFKIKGLGLLVISNVIPMDVLIFKAGYEHIGMGPWEALKWDGGLLEKKVRWEDNRAIIPLKKLTIEERRKQGSPDFYIGERYDKKESVTHSCIPQNIKLLPKEVNKELLEQGRKPYDLEGGRCKK